MRSSLERDPRTLVHDPNLVPARVLLVGDLNHAGTFHRLRAVNQQVQQDEFQLLKVPDDCRLIDPNVDSTPANRGSSLFSEIVSPTRLNRKGPKYRLMGPSKLKQVVDDVIQGVDPLDDFADDALFRAAVGNAASENLHGAADASQRVPDFVSYHGGHLAELGERGLMSKAASFCLRSVMS